ncbi:MAG: S8 family serine peptidase, partial [Proteobacteria bacterium]|nr:S8 family serine peptidase [Pseudomonadota bacterium]
MRKGTKSQKEKKRQGTIIDEELLDEFEFGAYEESDSVEVDVIVDFESAEKMKEFFDKIGKKAKKAPAEDVITELSYDDIVDAIEIEEAVLEKSIKEAGVDVNTAKSKTTGKTDVAALPFVDSVSIRLPKFLIYSIAEPEIAKKYGIRKIEEDREFEEFVEESVKQIGVAPLWDEGYTGKGIKVAVIDTGVDETHRDLEGKIIETKDFTGEGFRDATGHGTHVATTILGTGATLDRRFKGVAFDAKLYAGKVLYLKEGRGRGKGSWIIQAIDWAVKEDVDVINLSLGSKKPKHGKDALSLAVNKAVDEGVVVCVAAGNSGRNGNSTIGAPGAAAKAITVGAVDPENKIAVFSSQGPVEAEDLKPDIVAPGVDIVAGLAAGFSYRGPSHTDKPDLAEELKESYTYKSGTSMATPICAGVCALMLEAYYKKYENHRAKRKEEKLSTKVKDALLSTARNLGDDKYKQGKGLILPSDAINTFVPGIRVRVTPVPEEGYTNEQLLGMLKNLSMDKLERVT